MNNESKLPIWWQIFAIEYFRNGENAAGAYRKAKPNVSDKTAEVESCKLLKNPKFSRVLEEERQSLSKAIDMSKEEWVTELITIAKSKPEKIETSAKLKALEILGKAKGFLQMDVTSHRKSIGESIVDALAKIRAQPVDDYMPLTDAELERAINCEIVPD